jgi:hypothetical protein
MQDITSIRVDYKHVDGWHVFSSDKIAGLYVASPDPKRAYEDVAVALEKLLRLNLGIECKVAAEVPFNEFVKGKAKEEEPQPVTHLASHRYAVYACA